MVRGDSSRQCSAGTCQCQRQGEWTIADTRNFSLWTTLPQADAVALAGRCETLRAQLQERWSSSQEDEDLGWRPKCVVVVHGTSASYGVAIGARNDPSVGCTTVTVDHGEIVFRRIDFRGDAADWQRNALPHELTHVVLADLFQGRPVPQWLNEGMAMTSESAELQQRRLKLLEAAAGHDRLPPLQDLFAPNRTAVRADTDLHYAASLGLVSYLRRNGDADTLVRFAKHVQDHGHAVALRGVYGFEGGVPELERRWSESLTSLELASSVDSPLGE